MLNESLLDGVSDSKLQVSHNCHTDDKACPKCPFLVEKRCVCKQQVLKNQPCWFQEPRCGMPCNKLLKCGDHRCRKNCHKPGDCEDKDISGLHCNQLCQKPRESCDHDDIEQCHAPYRKSLIPFYACPPTHADAKFWNSLQRGKALSRKDIRHLRVPEQKAGGQMHGLEVEPLASEDDTQV